jgi:3-oxoacyl-[acyl-carrier protein] reductase
VSTPKNAVSFDFTGATALVTGGTSGIGYAIATSLADAGASVTITGTRADIAAYDDEPTQLERFEYVQVDTRDNDAVDALAARFDRLDILINNAGISMAYMESNPDHFWSSLHLNFGGAMRLSLNLHDALKASDLPAGASVVNVISMSAFRAVPVTMGYSSAKAALLALTKNLALHWMADNIRVNAIAPGLIETRLTSALKYVPEIEAEQLARIPAGRMGTAQECADAALFLCTSASSYTTGTHLAVDGGYLAF